MIHAAERWLARHCPGSGRDLYGQVVVLHRDLADVLRARILSGEFAVGEALPSEAKLCAQFGTSRGTVRQALASLRAEGLIGGGRGAPPVVRSRQMAQSFDTLMSFTRWALMSGRTPGQRTAEITRMPAPADIADALHIDPGDPIVRLLRLRLLDGEPAMLERTHFPFDLAGFLLTADLDGNSVYATLTEHGLAPATATHVFDAVGADETDVNFLGISPGAPLLRERRHACLESGLILEYSDDRYRPDLVTFTVLNAQAARPALSRTGSADAERRAL